MRSNSTSDGCSEKVVTKCFKKKSELKQPTFEIEST